MGQFETSPPSCTSLCKELGKIPSQMSLNLGSVSRNMANTLSSWKMFCCSVPLTTMRPPQPTWLKLPLTQKGRYSTGTLLGKGWCAGRRRSFSWLLGRNSFGVEVNMA
ncbi:hypothetical protein TNCV_2854741 [Trichonephila clavipes]|nr:hypothetical protein TNCV_2854741 [Trichonephila clavipes]